jgi:hypothetical protein
MQHGFIILTLLAIAPAILFFLDAVRKAGPEFWRPRWPFCRYPDETPFWFWFRSVGAVVWVAALIGMSIK